MKVSTELPNNSCVMLLNWKGEIYKNGVKLTDNKTDMFKKDIHTLYKTACSHIEHMKNRDKHDCKTRLQTKETKTIRIRCEDCGYKNKIVVKQIKWK